MRYYTEEEQIKAAEKFISDRECLVKAFPGFCSVIRAFNGKVYNKRLEAALREKIEGFVICKKNNTYITIELNMRVISCVKIECLTDQKRINADVFIESALEYREKYLKEINHMKQIIPTIETRRKQIEYIKKLLSGVIGDLDYTEKEIFGLNYSLRTY